MRSLPDGIPFSIRFALPKLPPALRPFPATARSGYGLKRARFRALTVESLEGRALLSTLPSVTTTATSPISAAGATLNASVNPEGSSTTVRFQYSTDPSFPLTVSTIIGSGFTYPSGVAG